MRFRQDRHAAHALALPARSQDRRLSGHHETDDRLSSNEMTPRELGYHMPAEWEPHEATWLSWPHKQESWPGAFESVPGIFVELTRHLAESELVRINVADADFAERVN